MPENVKELEGALKALGIRRLLEKIEFATYTDVETQAVDMALARRAGGLSVLAGAIYAGTEGALAARCLDKVAGYLPVSAPENLTRWLSNSLVAGNIPSANFIFRGELEEFPFKNKEGIFQGYGEIILETLDYHQAWPPADELNAEIVVNGDTLTFNVLSGKFFDAEITKASIVIPNLANKSIKKSVAINGHINGNVKDGLLFVNNSPLQKKQSFLKK